MLLHYRLHWKAFHPYYSTTAAVVLRSQRRTDGRTDEHNQLGGKCIPALERKNVHFIPADKQHFAQHFPLRSGFLSLSLSLLVHTHTHSQIHGDTLLRGCTVCRHLSTFASLHFAPATLRSTHTHTDTRYVRFVKQEPLRNEIPCTRTCTRCEGMPSF